MTGTATVLRTLITGAKEPLPAAICAAAFDVGIAALDAPAGADEQDNPAVRLLQTLACSPMTDPDTLVRLLSSPPNDARIGAACNSATPIEAVTARLRKERSAAVLCSVATGCRQSETLASLTALVASRARNGGLAAYRLVTALLRNAYLPDTDVVALLKQAELLAWDTTRSVSPVVRTELRQAAESILTERPHLCSEVVPALRTGGLRIIAAQQDLTAEAWEFLFEQHVRPVIEGTTPQLASGGSARLCREVLGNAHAPLPMRVRIAETYRRPNSPLSGDKTTHRLAVTLLQTDPVPDVDAVLTGGDPDALAAVLLHPLLTVEQARRIATSPGVPVKAVHAALDRAGKPDQDLACAIADCYSGRPRTRASLLVRLGPEYLDAFVNDTWSREAVLADVCRDLASGPSRSPQRALWMPALGQLSASELRAVPWRAAAGLAKQVDRLRPLLVQELAVGLAHPGAATLFAMLEPAFTGTVGELIGVLTAVTTDSQ